MLPSTLAALGAADGKQPTLVIKVDAHTTSIAILNEEQLQRVFDSFKVLADRKKVIYDADVEALAHRYSRLRPEIPNTTVPMESRLQAAAIKNTDRGSPWSISMP